MSEIKETEAQLWEQASDWGKHEIAQLRRMAKLPMSDKLQWLEEAHIMALHLQGKTLPVATDSDTLPK